MLNHVIVVNLCAHFVIRRGHLLALDDLDNMIPPLRLLAGHGQGDVRLTEGEGPGTLVERGERLELYLLSRHVFPQVRETLHLRRTETLQVLRWLLIKTCSKVIFVPLASL